MPPKRRKCNERFWVTKEGKVIPIMAMEDDHVINTVKLIKRWAENTENWIRVRAFYPPELRGDPPPCPFISDKRLEETLDAILLGLEFTQEDLLDCCRSYKSLRHEIKRRKLRPR